MAPASKVLLMQGYLEIVLSALALVLQAGKGKDNGGEGASDVRALLSAKVNEIVAASPDCQPRLEADVNWSINSARAAESDDH